MYFGPITRIWFSDSKPRVQDRYETGKRFEFFIGYYVIHTANKSCIFPLYQENNEQVMQLPK